MRGFWIFIPEDEAVELEEDTYFVHDIIGLVRADRAMDELLGTVTEVLFTGANDVYVVETPDEPAAKFSCPPLPTSSNKSISNRAF